MMAIPGGAGGLATARPGAGASGPDAAAADPGGFDEVFSEEGADRPERSDHRARAGDEGEAAPTGDAPATANAPPEQVRLPVEPMGASAPEPAPEAAGAALPAGLPVVAALADPTGAAADVPAFTDQPLADGETPPEGQFDLGKTLAGTGDGVAEAAVFPEAAEGPPPEPEAEPEASPETKPDPAPAAEQASGGPAAEQSPAASPVASTRPARLEAAVSAVAEALRPQKTEAPEGPSHGRHRRDEAAEPASERAAAPPPVPLRNRPRQQGQVNPLASRRATTSRGPPTVTRLRTR